jgi:hypothetical protein
LVPIDLLKKPEHARVPADAIATDARSRDNLAGQAGIDRRRQNAIKCLCISTSRRLAKHGKVCTRAVLGEGDGRSLHESSSNCQALAVTDQTPIIHAPFLTEAAAAGSYFEPQPLTRSIAAFISRLALSYSHAFGRTGPAQTGFLHVHPYKYEHCARDPTTAQPPAEETGSESVSKRPWHTT